MILRGTILQPWNWHSPRFDQQGQNLWQQLARQAPEIQRMGFSSVWLPPSTEAFGGPYDVGYGIKNWYSFENTKYGNKEQLQTACEALQGNGIEVYHDQVHNHLMGGEIEEGVWCLHVKCNNKNEPLTPDHVWFQADINTGYPWLQINHHHFDAYHPNSSDCWALSGKTFDREASQDLLMGCDLDFDNVDLVKKLEAAGLWFKAQIPVDGYRFDAIKHIRPKGTLNFLTRMRESEGRNLFAIGEYFDSNLAALHRYISETYGQLSLFDFPLQRKLVHASQQGRNFDMRSLSYGTLTKEQPTLSIPFVHSHDDQPPMHGGEHRGEYVGDWFVSHAYSMILLRDEGYPMVSNVDLIRHEGLIRRLLLARKHCTYGQRVDRFDHPNTIGWSFSNSFDFDNSMAVVMTNGEYGAKWLPTQRPNVEYRDLLSVLPDRIRSNHDGWAQFECPSGGVSVWVESTKYEQITRILEE